MLRASVRRVPLAGQSQTVCAPEGASLAQLVETAFPDAFLRRFVVAFVGGVEIAQDAWAELKPRAGDYINLCIRPGDGDSGVGKVLRTVLQIAVVAAAAWVGGMIGGLPGMLASAAISMAGNLLINTLIPISPLQAKGEAPAPFYTVTGARNQAKVYAPASFVLGKHRFFPPLYGRYVQETVGNDVYLRVPFCLGPAPVQYSEPKIGDTPLSSFEGVEIEERLTADAPDHTLYTGDPDQEAVGAQLTTTYTARNTAPDVDEIEVVLGFRGGLGGYDSKQRKVSKSVGFEIRYRPAGTSDAWQTHRPDVPQANAASTAAGVPFRPSYFLSLPNLTGYIAELNAIGTVPSGPVVVSRADPGRGFQHVVRFAVPRHPDGYAVEVRRTTAESSDPNTIDAVWWEILGSVKSFVDPFPERGIASLVLRIKASAQLSGVIDSFNCIVEPQVPLFSAGAKTSPDSASAASLTTTGVSRNPAEIVLNLYRGPQAARPRPDDRIDWPAWAAFAAFCETKGLHYDEVIDVTIGRGELARRICASAFARPIRWGGKLSVVIDRDRTGEAPAQVFTPRNVANLQWRKAFPLESHAVRIAFNNADNGYQADEITLYLDGYDAANATKFETLAVSGKTDPDEVRRVGRQFINNALRQTESFSFDMDAEALTCRPGAYAVLLHDAIGVGLGAARVKSLETSGGNVTAFVLDVGVATEAADAHAARWRKSDGQGGFKVASDAAVTRDGANPVRFVFASPQPIDTAPAVEDMVLIGIAEEVALPVLVRDVAPDYNHRASITVIPYAGERFTPDGEELPPHNPMVQLPIAARPATPVELSTTANAREIALAFFQGPSPRGVTLTGFETAVREHGNANDSWQDRGPLPADARVFVAPPGNPGYSYDLRVVAVGNDNGGLPVRSDPLIVENVAAAISPAAPAGCSAAFETRTSAGGASQLVLVATWTAVEDPDVLDTRVEMRTATAPDVYAEIGQGRAANGRTEIHGLQVGRSYVLGFVHLSRRGIASTRTVIASITAPDTLVATAAHTAAPGSPLEADFDAALDAATAAAASAAAALAAEIEAEAAEATAIAQAVIATAQAGAATTSAAGAAGSASAASTSAGAASTSAGNAAASATTAGNHAATASGHASTATTQAAAATTAAAAASASETVTARYARTTAFPRAFEQGLWSAYEHEYDNTGAYLLGSSAFATNADGVRVFRTDADAQGVVVPVGTFVPQPGRKYIARWRVRKIQEGTDGRPSSHHPYFIGKRADGVSDYFRDSAGPVSMDGLTWTLNQWYTVEVPWTVPALPAIAWARPRWHYNWDDAGSSYSNARYEFGAFEFEDVTNVTATNAQVATNTAAIAAASSSLASLTTTVSANFTTLDNKTNANPNLMPYPSGNARYGESAAASALGWQFAGPVGSPLFNQIHYTPRGGPEYYIEWASGFTAAGYQQPFFDIPISDGGTYTLSMNIQDYNCSANIALQCLNAARNTDTTTATSASPEAPGSMARISCWATGNSSTRYLRVFINVPPQTVTGYAAIAFNQIKVERGSVATVFTDDARMAEANASIVTNASAIAAANASIASLTTTVTSHFQTSTSGLLVSNSQFQQPLVSAIPTGWANWSGSGGSQVARIGAPGYAFRQVGPAGGAAGISQMLAHGSVSQGPYLLRATIRRTSGPLNGSGVYVIFYNASDGVVGDAQVDFTLEANVNGATTAYPDGVVAWEKQITAPANTSKALIFAMTHWQSGNFGSVATANQIDWHEVDLVPVGNAQVRLTLAEATIASHASSISTNTSAIATLNSTVSANFTALREGGDSVSLPSTFEKDDLYWQKDNGGTFTNVSNIGRVFQASDVAHYVRSRGRLQLRPNRTYRLSARYRVATDSTNGFNPQPLAGLTLFNSANINTAGIWVGSFVTRTTADGWVTVTGDYSTATILGVDASAVSIDAYCQPNWYPTANNPNAITQVQFVKLEDVTDIVTVTSQITEVRTAVTDAGGGYAYWGMKLDGGGRFASMEALASSKTNIAEFRFTADKFKVYNGSADEAPFVVEGGVVKAKKVQAAELSAITANIGTLRTASSGARMELRDNVLVCYDASGVDVVKLGNLSL